MSSFAAAIGDLFNAIFHVIGGIFNTFAAAVQGVVDLVVGLVRGLFGAAEGILGFIIGNIFIIAVIGAAFVGYRLFVQQKSVGGVKKTS